MQHYIVECLATIINITKEVANIMGIALGGLACIMMQQIIEFYNSSLKLILK